MTGPIGVVPDPATPPVPRAPAGLARAGAALWRSILSDFELDKRELAILEQACRQADDIAGLDALIVDEGRMITGSRGQTRLAGAVTEVRQGRLALGKLLAQIALPSAEGETLGRSAQSTRAQKAANARHGRDRRVREARRG
jgi:hypothetical protein